MLFVDGTEEGAVGRYFEEVDDAGTLEVAAQGRWVGGVGVEGTKL